MGVVGRLWMTFASLDVESLDIGVCHWIVHAIQHFALLTWFTSVHRRSQTFASTVGSALRIARFPPSSVSPISSTIGRSFSKEVNRRSRSTGFLEL